MHERAGAGRARRLGDVARALVLHRFEGLLAGRKQDADEIDDGIGAVGSREQRVGKAHIGLHGVDLADAAKRLKEAGELGPPDGDPHARPGLGDGAHHMAADEARAAIDGDERPVVESYRHVRVPWSSPFRRMRRPQQYTSGAKPCEAPPAIDFAGTPIVLEAHQAQVAELVDALASGASARKGVEVRVFSWAPFPLS